MKKKLFLMGMFGMMLAFGVVVFGCGNVTPGETEPDPGTSFTGTWMANINGGSSYIKYEISYRTGTRYDSKASPSAWTKTYDITISWDGHKFCSSTGNDISLNANGTVLTVGLTPFYKQ
jgi:hypothetical protein